MSKLYITEFAGLLPSGIPAGPALAEQTPVTIGSAANQSASFGVNTRAVRLHTDAICSYSCGGAAASTSSPRLTSNQTEYVSVVPGGSLSVIVNT